MGERAGVGEGGVVRGRLVRTRASTKRYEAVDRNPAAPASADGPPREGGPPLQRFSICDVLQTLLAFSSPFRGRAAARWWVGRLRVESRMRGWPWMP